MQAWKEQALNIQISKLHQDVSEVLTSLGIEHHNEYLTEDEYYSIDIAILEGTIGQSNLALEVDGPFHFASNTQAPLGKHHTSSGKRLKRYKREPKGNTGRKNSRIHGNRAYTIHCP